MRWAVLALLLLAPTAAAHAEAYASSPAQGQRLDEAPSVVWVDFTEPVYREGSWIRVVGADGTRLDNGDLQFLGSEGRPRLQVSVQPLADGAYSIRWQTYSQSDGHTIQGTIGFAVGGFAPPAGTEADSDLGVAAALARTLLYAGIALGIGSIAYAAAVLRSILHDERRNLALAAGLALAGTALLTWDTWQGTGLAWSTYAQSEGGQPFVTRTLLIAALLAFTAVWWRWPVVRREPVVIGWAVFTWLTASFGHVTREGRWAIALEWSHMVAVSVWIGGLWLFLRTMRIDPVPLGARFTRMAQWAVLAVIVTGSIISALLVGRLARHDPATLWSAEWAWFLAAKVGLVAAMLFLAAINRYVFLDHASRLGRWVASWRPDWTATGEARRRNLRKAATVEAGISGLVIVAAALLLSVSPPGEAGPNVPVGLERTAAGNDYLATLTVSPAPQVGQSHTFLFYIQDTDGQPLVGNTCGRDDCLRVRWLVDDDPSTQQEALIVEQGDGWWRAEDILFTAAGNTTVVAEVSSAYVYRDDLRFAPFWVP